jgi:hypothetical protein
MKIDAVICCAQKDYNKLPFAVGAALRNIKDLDTVYIITPGPIAPLPLSGEIRYFKDRDVLDIDISRWKFRPNWIYQQFLKLFQCVTTHEYYVTIDSDTVITRPLSFFDDFGKPIWYCGRDQYHKPYFVFQKKILGLERVYPHSFINDMNLLNRHLIDEMLKRNGFTFETFLETSYRIINKKCYCAEPELYGNYVTKYHPDLYSIRQLSTCYEGKFQADRVKLSWDESSINAYINQKSAEGFDIIAFHSWSD